MSAYQVCPVARMEKLLLAVDGSLPGEGAVREAINLAKTCGSKLYIISVIEIPAFGGEFVETLTEMVEKLETDTRGLLETLKERANKEGVSSEAIMCQGEEAYRYIVDEAAKNNVEMIIMGRHGRTGLERLMMGSVTAKVIGHAPCKVMVVPRAAKPLTFEKILIATDGSIYSELASREAISIAKRTGASLIALSVAKRDENLPMAEASVDMVKDIAEREGIRVKTLTRKGEPYEVIVNTAEQENALLIVGSHGRTGIKRLMMGSVTERVVGRAGCPVLVVKKG